MKLFQIRIDIKENIKAEDEQEAKAKFFEMIESEPQQTLGTFISERIQITEIPDEYDRVSQKPLSSEDAIDRAIEEGFCPHCDVKLVTKIFDIDGTNLEEHLVCPTCGYGSPALR